MSAEAARAASTQARKLNAALKRGAVEIAKARSERTAAQEDADSWCAPPCSFTTIGNRLSRPKL